ncbi:GNAT family acetyltransferase [Stakelama sp. CBK3Z-3]|uniref:GNAT family acetyltransferase n=1 Tax=Stakelama flava TaxID=2860338 RepID=A0ABS6XM79_9SPHN|nr:GNAT family acetyltransferase [Stakelama flava]MBW4331314.1 GNAT family acetyltransferase [Stakelama flava]
MTAIIRTYRDSDFDDVDSLWRRCFPDAPERNRAEYSIPAKLAVDDGLLLVADAAGAVAGSVMAGYDGHRGWLYAVAVDPDYRMRGIGAALVRAAEARLLELGCAKVNLQILGENAPVARFYHQLGYEIEERISMGRLLRA